MSRGYGDDFYKNVTLAVNVAGQGAVDAYERSMLNAKAALQAHQSQMQAGRAVTADQLKDLAALKAAYDQTAAAAVAADRVIAGKAAEAGGHIRGLGQSIQEFGRGFQDYMVAGPLGAVNNASRFVEGLATAAKLSTPWVQGLGAATDISASLALALYQNWDTFKKLTDDGISPRLMVDLKTMNKELEELRSKPLPSLIDQMDIQNLDRAADQLGKVEAALKAMRALTSDQQKAGKVVTTGVVEGGGLEAIVKSYLDATGGVETPEQAAVKKKIADFQALENAASASGQDESAALYARNRQDLERTEAGKRSADRANREIAARRLVGAAGTGDEASRAELAAVYDRSRDVFERNGATFRFRQSLEDAAPLNLHRDEQDKISAENEREFRQERDKAIREAVASTKRGFDDSSADAIQDAIQAGTSPEDAKRAAKAVILPQLKARGVGKSIVEAVADAIVGDAADAAQNRISEGQKSALQVKRDTAEDRAKREAEQEVNKHVAAAQGGYADEAEATIYRGLQQGRDADAIQAGELPALSKAIRDRGNVPEKYVEDVAKKILAAATEKAINDLDSGEQPKQIRQGQTAKDAADKKQIADIGAPFLQYAETLLARNRLAARNGAPVARDEADVQRFRRSGAEFGDFALPEAEMQRRVGVDLAQGLRNTGADPKLAGPMMKAAADKLGDSVSRSMATGANEQQALIGVIHDLADQFGQIQAHVANSAGVNGPAIQALQKKTGQLRQQNGRIINRQMGAAQVRPSLIQY